MANTVEVTDLPLNTRNENIRKTFITVYKTEPTFYVRVPGRVNLIGEHIDYCGFGVCPMALDQDIFLAVGIINNEKKTLSLYNIDQSLEKYECCLDKIEITLNNTPPKWYEYFLCGIKGILESLHGDHNNQLNSLTVVIDGNIPQSAGLSSSSALVSSAALTTAYAMKLHYSKEKLANICAASERYIGTEGGGMDQAIAFLAKTGCAKLIEFDPLRSKEIQLPSRAVFVIAHSLIKMNKAATADFNCRVVECKLAAQIISKRKGIDWMKVKRLGDLQNKLGLTLEDMISLTKEILNKTIYTKADIIHELDTTSNLLDNVSLTSNTNSIDNFKLRQRALHVFNEAQRVNKFIEICENTDVVENGVESSVKLGKLMNESHESLKNLYECSHPQLDKIVELAAGITLGTRLTGAGWGGCTVSLVFPENVEKFITKLKKEFYAPLGIIDGFESIVFTTAPKAGACIYLSRN